MATALQQNWSNSNIVTLEALSNYASNKMISSLDLDTSWGKNQNKTNDVEHSLIISSNDILKGSMVFHFNSGTHASGRSDVTFSVLINGEQVYTKLIARPTDDSEDVVVPYNSVNITTAGIYTVITRTSSFFSDTNNDVQTFSTLFY